MKRFSVLVTSFLVLAGAGIAAAASDDGGYGPWEPTFQGAITAPAGAVCPFQVTASPVREDLRVQYHRDAAGNVDGYRATGQLIARITNDATGKSVVRNLSGPGTVVFNPDGSYDAVVSGGFLIFFLRGDNPASELLLLPGHTELHGNPDGTKTLVSTTGQTENLCETLA
jgi:hypothetical protein